MAILRLYEFPFRRDHSLAKICSYREQDVHYAYSHFWDRLSCTIGKSKTKQHFNSSCFYKKNYWIAHFRFYSCSINKQAGYPDVLWGRWVFLLLIRNLSSRQLLIVLGIVFTIMISSIVYILFGKRLGQTYKLVEPNNYPDYLQYNWQFFKIYHQMYGIYIEMLFHFLLGFWISKAGILKKINENKKFRSRLLINIISSNCDINSFNYFILEDLYPVITKALVVKWLIYSATRIFSILWYVMTTACVTLYATILISLSRSAKENGFCHWHPLDKWH
jgi:hypothetical protein